MVLIRTSAFAVETSAAIASPSTVTADHWIEINNPSELAADALGWGGIVQGRASGEAGKRYVASTEYKHKRNCRRPK
jgi:hypothetical protein